MSENGKVEVSFHFEGQSTVCLDLDPGAIPRKGDVVQIPSLSRSPAKETWQVYEVHWVYDYSEQCVSTVGVALRRPLRLL
jgi:hypothetical protein